MQFGCDVTTSTYFNSCKLSTCHAFPSCIYVEFVHNLYLQIQVVLVHGNKPSSKKPCHAYQISHSLNFKHPVINLCHSMPPGGRCAASSSPNMAAGHPASAAVRRETPSAERPGPGLGVPRSVHLERPVLLPREGALGMSNRRPVKRPRGPCAQT